MTNFTHFYVSYYAKLVRFAKDYVIYEEDAENITQDVFFCLLEKNDLLNHVENVDSYIYKSVRNKCLDFLKSKLIHEKHVAILKSGYESECDLYYRSCHEYDYELDQEPAVGEIINRAVEALPARCREIFMLSRYEGLKYKEISERLGLSVNTVDVQIGIALKKLRRQLTPHLCA